MPRSVGAHLLIAGVLCVAQGAFATGPASAEEVVDLKASATAHFVRGVELAKAARWSEARAAFLASNELRPHARTHFNLAVCDRALGRFASAWTEARAALRRDDERGELDVSQRDAARELEAEVLKKVARVRVTLEATDVSLTVDGAPLHMERSRSGAVVLVAGAHSSAAAEPIPAEPFELLLDQGLRHLRVEGPGGARRDLHRTFLEGQVTELVLALPTEGGPAAPQLAAAPSRPALRARPTAAIVLGSLGLVAAGATTGLAVHAAAVHGEARDGCPLRPHCSTDDPRELALEARRFASGATVTGVLAVGSLVGAAVLYATSPAGSTDLELTVGASGVVMSHKF